MKDIYTQIRESNEKAMIDHFYNRLCFIEQSRYPDRKIEQLDEPTLIFG